MSAAVLLIGDTPTTFAPLSALTLPRQLADANKNLLDIVDNHTIASEAQRDKYANMMRIFENKGYWEGIVEDALDKGKRMTPLEPGRPAPEPGTSQCVMVSDYPDYLVMNFELWYSREYYR